MDIQTMIVGIIFLAAAAYAANLFVGKLRAFSARTGQCGDNCGCGSPKRGGRPR